MTAITAHDQVNVWLAPLHPEAIAHIPGAKYVRSDPPTCRLPYDALDVVNQRLGTSFARPQEQPTLPWYQADFMEKLRPYQLEGVATLNTKLRTEGAHILADDMGLGKTLQTLATWVVLGRPAPLLICCPASVRETWRKEVKKWLGEEPLVANTGPKLAKATPGDRIIVTSYNLAVDKLPVGISPGLLVLDEAHLLRGRTAQRARALYDLACLAKYKLALTGTPQWSRPRDWWQLLKVLFGYRFGTADEFDYAYCGARINQWGGKENKGSTRAHELAARVKHIMTRRTKEQVAKDLPALTREVKLVDATAEAKRASDAFVMGQLRLHDALAATLVAKFDTVVETVQEAGNCLVFTWQKEHARQLGRSLMKEDIEVEVITGDMSHAEREAAVQRAIRRPGGCTVVATIDSTGTGVDGLQYVPELRTVVFHSIDYVPIKMAQSEARLHRIGQHWPVTVVYIAMRDTVDTTTLETVVGKLDQWRDVMGQDSTAGLGSTLFAAGNDRDEAAVVAEILNTFKEE